jgi:hypothetical protein
MAALQPLTNQASDAEIEAAFRRFWSSETALPVGPAAHTVKMAVAWGRHLLRQASPQAEA